MRIIHSGGFTVDEKQQNRAVIYSNMIVAFKVLLDIMSTENFEFESDKTKVSLDSLVLRSIQPTDVIGPCGIDRERQFRCRS